MKSIILIVTLIAGSLLMGCAAQSKGLSGDQDNTVNDTVRISNDALEYEVLIIDAGFNRWFNLYAKPRNYYTQSYLESRNAVWVQEWNNRVLDIRRNKGMFEMRIDYLPGIDYGYEVNYMLFNYLTYYQLTNEIRLGGFEPRI
jgi:hypothetical protein